MRFDAKDERLDLTSCSVSVHTSMVRKKQRTEIKEENLEENKRNVKVISFCVSDLSSFFLTDDSSLRINQ